MAASFSFQSMELKINQVFGIKIKKPSLILNTNELTYNWISFTTLETRVTICGRNDACVCKFSKNFEFNKAFVVFAIYAHWNCAN